MSERQTALHAAHERLVYERMKAQMAEGAVTRQALLTPEVVDLDPAEAERVAILEDRDRIAQDLHDHVIQRIFATGLTLDAVAERTGASPTVIVSPSSSTFAPSTRAREGASSAITTPGPIAPPAAPGCRRCRAARPAARARG